MQCTPDHWDTSVRSTEFRNDFVEEHIFLHYRICLIMEIAVLCRLKLLLSAALEYSRQQFFFFFL